MNKHRKRLIQSLSVPFLMPGEEIEIITAAKPGKAPVRQNAAKLGGLMIAFAVAALLGAGLLGYVQPARRAPRYFVLTDRKLIMFGSRGRGGISYLASAPRAEVTASIAEKALFRLKVRLDVSAPTRRSITTVRLPSMRLTYPLLSRSLRRTGRQLVASLQSGAAAETSPAEV